MVGSDYIHGNEKRELAPRDNITRAEFAQIFHNIIQEYIVKEGTYTGDRSGNLLVRMDEVTLEDMYIDGDLIIGCGAADGTVTLDNVPVSGRIVVWGGGTEAVWMNNGTRTDELTAATWRRRRTGPTCPRCFLRFWRGSSAPSAAA